MRETREVPPRPSQNLLGPSERAAGLRSASETVKPSWVSLPYLREPKPLLGSAWLVQIVPTLRSWEDDHSQLETRNGASSYLKPFLGSILRGTPTKQNGGKWVARVPFSPWREFGLQPPCFESIRGPHGAPAPRNAAIAPCLSRTCSYKTLCPGPRVGAFGPQYHTYAKQHMTCTTQRSFRQPF